MLFNELTRIESHLVWLGSHAMDIGALTVFLYCFREREQLMRIFEAVSGQRMMTSYIRIGGLSLEPPRDLYDQIRAFLKDFPSKVDEYEGLLNNNPIWMNRMKGVGYLSAEEAIALGVTGRRCVHRVWILMCGATCLTRATRSSSSMCRRRRSATCGRATSSACRSCASR